MTLLLKNIHKSFFYQEKEIKILDNINLEIKRGEITSLVGQSGAGKSTLIQIAGLLDQQTSGEVYINKNIINNHEKSRTKIRRKEIGFIYQSHYLFNEINSIDNVSIPLLIAGLSKKQAKIKSEKILEDVGLENRKYFFPHQLSGGEKQRVSIARALVKDLSIILADEPTGNLDAKNSNNIFNIILNLTKKKNISCLFVTHNQELSKKSDRIISISDGKI